MKKSRRFGALLVAGVAGALAIPLLVLVPGSRAATTTPDKIAYFEQKNTAYLQYVPGSGTGGFSQGIASGGGGCSSPTISGVPILQFSASYYPNGYAAASQPASAGAYQGRTGVCAIPQDWSIEPGEGLVFSVGPNTVTAGRLFVEAQIALARQDKSTSPSVAGQLVLRRQDSNGIEQVVQTIPYTINGPQGTAITADTGTIASGFDQVEIQINTASGSISVVGPTSTFTLENQLCAGNIQTSGSSGGDTVNASVTYVAGTVCKNYTTFSATDSSTKLVNFSGGAAPGVTLSAHLDWGNFPFCVPATGAGPAGTPACPPTQVSFDGGGTFQPETFCPAANPPSTPAWCATNVQYQYVTVNGTTMTHIVEDWSGQGDPIWAH